jgi:hypothetical protein
MKKAAVIAFLLLLLFTASVLSAQVTWLKGSLEDARMAQEKAIATDMGGANTEYFKSQLKKIQAEIEKRKK